MELATVGRLLERLGDGSNGLARELVGGFHVPAPKCPLSRTGVLLQLQLYFCYGFWCEGLWYFYYRTRLAEQPSP